MTTHHQSAHVSTDAPQDAWEPFPLDAIEGEPNGQVNWLRQTTSGDGMLLTGMFTCDPAKIDYTFVGDESLHLLEGTITVEMEDGETVELQPGDTVSFAKGAKSVWHIHEPMKKFFVISG